MRNRERIDNTPSTSSLALGMNTLNDFLSGDLVFHSRLFETAMNSPHSSEASLGIFLTNLKMPGPA